jgi:uncharacterized protein YbbC (DUF1343 family)/CubicO group peptidase (beta-lactamase class C family)
VVVARLVLPFVLVGSLLLALTGSASAATPVSLTPDFAAVDEAARDAIASGDIPGVVVLVGRGDEVLYHRAWGSRELVPEPAPMLPDTIFDIASLTKPFGTALAVMTLVDRGAIKLDAPLGRYLKEFKGRAFEEVTIRRILTHTAGLPSIPAPGTLDHGFPRAAKALARRPLDYPPGTGFQYSDTGFILLAEVVRRVSGDPLDRYLERVVFRPLRLHDTFFHPPERIRRRIAPTEFHDGVLLQGRVHDPRARQLGGVAGHAGMFSTAADLAKICRMLLDGGELDGRRVLRPASVRAMWTRSPEPDGMRGLGWDVASPFARPMLSFFPPDSVGHTGFTGTAVWIDPASRAYLILLTNRVHPYGGGAARIRELRERVSAAVAAALFVPQLPSVVTVSMSPAADGDEAPPSGSATNGAASTPPAGHLATPNGRQDAGANSTATPRSAPIVPAPPGSAATTDGATVPNHPGTTSGPHTPAVANGVTVPGSPAPTTTAGANTPAPDPPPPTMPPPSDSAPTAQAPGTSSTSGATPSQPATSTPPTTPRNPSSVPATVKAPATMNPSTTANPAAANAVRPVPVALPRVVRTGLDVLVDQGFAPFRGQTIALVTNQTGIDARGRRSIDLFAAAPGVRLVSIFSPEHGITGLADADVANGRDAVTGLPIWSLYGPTRRPTHEMLRGVSVVVFDIQDVGVRYYTYLTTLVYVLEEAGRRGIPVVVLDRPDPITGRVVEGPVMDADLRSFTAPYPLPVRTGLTIGEFARLVVGERQLPVSLTVVPVAGWERSRWYDETGLPWVNPSPNIRSVTQALLYSGVGLLEATNLSVGRGTDMPFEVVGAPWIEPHRLAAVLNGLRLPGVSFEAVTFTPTADHYTGTMCWGVRLVVTDRDAIRPVTVALALARVLRDLHRDQFRPEAIQNLLVHRPTMWAFLRSEPLARLMAWAEMGRASFLNRRASYLIYP